MSFEDPGPPPEKREGVVVPGFSLAQGRNGHLTAGMPSVWNTNMECRHIVDTMQEIYKCP
jgi:hypothetical protein